MEEAISAAPFSKLNHNIYEIIEILMYLDRSIALKFMFSLTKQSRTFFQKHFISINNGFINEGLIVYPLGCFFNHYF